MVSIIIRTKNEERWITSCLQAVFDQDHKDIEVIIVDNYSTDKTVEKAKKFNVRVISTEDYLPGKAINQGIRAAKGEIIVCLSAHCIPVNKQWLSHLIADLSDIRIAGVYGRQEPMSFSSDFDKRDLLITFGLDKRVQVKDSFFHNANSAFRRHLWEEIPFDEKVTNIEDRVWAEEVIKRGYQIVYEPQASVFHYHGIHHDLNPERAANIVKILEEIRANNFGTKHNRVDIEKLNIIAIVPVRGRPQIIGGHSLLELTLKRANQSKYLKAVYVSTDNEETARESRELGAQVPFLRDGKYSQPHVDLEKVLQYTLNELEESKILPDIVVSLEVTFPFRDETLIDDLIFELITQGLDTVVPSKEEFNSCWIEDNGVYKRIDEGFIPRAFKKPVFTGYKGLGCATYAVFIREGKLFGNKVGIYKISNPNSFIEVREEKDFELAEKLIRDGFAEQLEKK